MLQPSTFNLQFAIFNSQFSIPAFLRFAFHSRDKQQIVKVEAEIGYRRDRHHFYLFDAAVGLERESHERVSLEGSVAPARDKGVVLPVLEIPDAPAYD